MFFVTSPPGWFPGDELVNAVEIRFLGSDLNRADLRAVRQAGGEYTECRGHEYHRWVTLPSGAADVFERLMKQLGKLDGTSKKWDRPVRPRGPIEHFGLVHWRAAPELRLGELLGAAERFAMKHGLPCTCCGRLVAMRSSATRRCAECASERSLYERAAHAANVSVARYELAERCLWAANQGAMAIFEELGGYGP